MRCQQYWMLLFVCCAVFASPLQGWGQSAQRLVSWEFNGQPLRQVLTEIADREEVQFAYSPEFIPLRDPVRLSVRNKPMETALTALFDPLDVTYRIIGGQIVLRPTTKPTIERISMRELPREVPQQTPLYVDADEQARIAEIQRRWRGSFPAIEGRKAPSLSTSESFTIDNLRDYQLQPAVSPDANEGRSRLAQISLLPYLGTNALRSGGMTNKVSVNLLWGTNGGVEGFEVGGLVNSILQDVEGVQIAGLGNTVGDNVTGTQVAGVFNVVGDEVKGVQASGLFNVAGEASAVQIAGLFNVANRRFTGVQGAGLFNRAGESSGGVQLAGLANRSRGQIDSQISGFFNIANDVTGMQFSPLFNVGRRVSGLQFALINVADTVSGVSIGLLNLINKGYNRLEIAGSETLYGNISLKLGVKPFYNIFYIGVRTDDLPATTQDADPDKVLTWGLGYGLGTAIPLGRRSLLNIEALSIHVNEREEWTTSLNLLNQVRLLVDFSIGRHLSFFTGPVGNLMLSKRRDPVSGELGSQLAPYTWLNDTKNGVTRQAWIGFSAGIRL